MGGKYPDHMHQSRWQHHWQLHDDKEHQETPDRPYDLKVYDTTACKTMQDIASDPSKFYSTDGGNITKCPSAANPNFTDLVSIFNNVAASIMKKRRIPSGTTLICYRAERELYSSSWLLCRRVGARSGFH